MPVRVRLALLLAAVLIAGACGKSTPAATITTTVKTLQPSEVKIADINVVSSTVGSVVVGEVQNVSTTAIGGIQLDVSFTQKNGKVEGAPLPAAPMLNVLD
ncbi:MAG TPA: hypothetical protein VKY26_00155, partial [Actinomycetota bacterium]|nr:hypothetical protein [Actinomycetota bacterium]